MATQVQFRRGSTSDHSSFTGVVGEVTVDTNKDTVVIHDGSTAGGHPLMREDGSNSAIALGSAATPALKFTSDTDTGIYSPGANQLAISTGGTGRLFIDSSGNVGIGTSSPSSKLTVDGSVNISGAANKFVGPTAAQGSSAAAPTYSFSGQSTGMFLAASNNLGFSTDATEKLRIDSSGNVGIGTSSPGKRLQIGDDTVNSSNVIAFGKRVTATQSNKPLIGQTSNGTENDLGLCATSSGGAIRFFTGNDASGFGAGNNDERMRIDAVGNVLVGTTINGGTGGVTIRPNASNGAATVVFDRANTTATSTVFAFENNDGTVGTITHDNTGTAYNTSSDYRLKENVVDLDGAIDRVKQLAPKRFNFIANPDTTVDGFLAHEAQTVVPEAVTGTHNEVDDDGNAVMQGIDQSKLVPLLTAALQEAIAEIETLKTKVAALEAG